MKKCMICDCDKNESEFNVEHIVPKALGGSLTICICEKCNSYLNENADRYLINFYNILKYIHRIPDRNTKKIKHPIGTVKTNEGNIKYYYDEKEDKSKSIHFSKEIFTLENNIIHYTGDPSIPPNKVIKMLKKFASRNKVNITEQNIHKFKKSLEKPKIIETEVIETVNVSLGFETSNGKISRPLSDKGIIKIAYELGCYFLGELYLEDSVGKKIRKCILGKKDMLSINNYINEKCDIKNNLYEKILIKSIFRNVDNESLGQIRITSIKKLPTHLIAIIKEENKLCAYIKLFDDESFCITISEDSEKYENIKKMCSVAMYAGTKAIDKEPYEIKYI